MRQIYDRSLKACRVQTCRYAIRSVYNPANWMTDHDAALLFKLSIELGRVALLLQLVYNASHLFDKLSVHNIYFVRLYLCRLGWNLGKI